MNGTRLNLSEKLAQVHVTWSPHKLAELNGQQVLLAKLEGKFVWHAHAEEDELFLVLEGRLTMEFRDRSVELSEGDMIVVPRGVEHRPRANEVASVLLFEPLSTKHTGDVRTERTRDAYPWV